MAYKDLGLVKITEKSALYLWERGVPIIVVGSNVNSYHFFKGWNLAYEMPSFEEIDRRYEGKKDPAYEFDVVTGRILSSLQPELGRRLAFFVDKRNL
jgi:hypothetical protein